MVDAICQEHGPYQAKVLTLGVDKPIVSHCPTCTAVRAAQDRDRKEREDKFIRDSKLRKLREEAWIPVRFQSRDFSNYKAEQRGQKLVMAACREFADAWPDRLKDGFSLVLSGGPGTGKTHLACAIANSVIENHLASVLFGTVSCMLRSIKETYRKGSERGEQDAINDLMAPDLLILDEVGVQVGSEHEKMLMFEVLNDRYQECRPTILISNLSTTDLEAFLGQRIMDRYRECGAVLAFDWQSHRGQV